MLYNPIAVLGATSLVGASLIPRLDQKGYRVTAVSRKPIPPGDHGGVLWVQADVSAGAQLAELAGIKSVISLAPIWVTAAFTANPPSGLERLVALSSTSVIAKAGTASQAEKRIVEKLRDGENFLMESCARLGIKWTILRPTMIHGGGKDGNVAAIARFIAKFRFFPIVGQGLGKRAPVHAADVAAAAALAMEGPAAIGKVYDISGGEVLSYHDMAARIFQAMGKRPRIVNIPTWLARGGVRALSLAPRFSHLNPELVERMIMDIAFDNTPAREDFGYAPGPFVPDMGEPTAG
jgi:nucleoside-diphosphate-sugar epimerase